MAHKAEEIHHESPGVMEMEMKMGGIGESDSNDDRCQWRMRRRWRRR